MIDLTSDFGVRAAAHLRDDPILWLTTVVPGRGPLPTPVWFLWDGAESLRVYSLPTAKRLEHIAANQHVAAHFDGDGHGGDIVVFSGRASVDAGAPPADQAEAYLAKYASGLERLGITAGEFAARYTVAVRVNLTRLRGH